MKQLSKNIDDINQLTAILSSAEIREPASSAFSTLIHIYTAFADEKWLQSIAQEIQLSYPNAHIIGATTCGEIFNGETVLEQTIINFSFFTSTQIHPFVMPIMAGEELEVGRYLRNCVDDLGDAVPAIMLLTTPITTNANAVARGLMASPPSFQIFGGGAGDYTLKSNYVMYGSTVYTAAVIVVAFQGPELQVEKTSFLGWRSMSHEMTITEASGTTIHTIDGRPAFEIYQHYFNIQNDAQFFSNALGFPLIINRNHQLIALVPVTVGLNNSLEFISDVYVGEKVSIGFMDTELIQKNLDQVYGKMLAFQPESLLIYSCGCRRWALRDDIKSETNTFERIAPTAGFYTVGEFCNQDTALPQLNLSFVVVGMREGPLKVPLQPILNQLETSKNPSTDIYKSSHLNVITKLIHFNNVLNHELLLAQKKAEQLSNAKSQFLANMSHEIRTPMAAIIGFTDLALLEDLPAIACNYIQIISTASKDLLTIINDILDTSKLEAGQMRLKLEPFKLIDIKTTLQELLLNAAQAKGLILTIDIGFNLPDTFIGDSLRLRQVLINLLSNAIKFTPQGSVNLSISLQQLSVTEAVLLFAITDTGIGIRAEQQDKLFQAFNQVHDDFSRGFEGTGLGLNISQNLVQLMSSSIKLDSHYELGSCFSFELTLPLVDLSSTEPQVIPTTTLKAELLSDVRILVVENDVRNQKIINQMLLNFGASIVHANNGIEALATLEQDNFDIVLMDLHMPGMDGYEVTLAIRKQARYAKLPIIMLSAGITDKEKRRCLANGMNDFIGKPINKIDLLTTLKQWLKP